MVKTNMSTDGSESGSESLAATRSKLKIQQRLIDIAARNLEASRESCRNLSTTAYGASEEAQSTIDENIVLQEVYSRPSTMRIILVCACPKENEPNLSGVLGSLLDGRLSRQAIRDTRTYLAAIVFHTPLASRCGENCC